MSAPGEATPVMLDVRPGAAFEALHRAGSANIPLEELARRIHELPPRDVPLTIFDESRTRARWAASRLRARERVVAAVHHGAAWLGEGPTEGGPSRVRLWRPHGLLFELIELIRRDGWLQLGGGARPRALDIACGAGRDAVYLALMGFDVEAWDILPDALAMADELAARNGAAIKTARRDVEREPDLGEPAYDLICCFNFLHRPLLPRIAAAIRPGGLVAYETFVEPQREKFGKPSRAAHVLAPGELAAAFADWEILVSREGLTGPRRYAASLIARKRQ